MARRRRKNADSSGARNRVSTPLMKSGLAWGCGILLGVERIAMLVLVDIDVLGGVGYIYVSVCP